MKKEGVGDQDVVFSSFHSFFLLKGLLFFATTTLEVGYIYTYKSTKLDTHLFIKA